MELKRQSTFGIGGDVATFRLIREWEDIDALIDAGVDDRADGPCRAPYFLGQGTNLLFPDEVFERPILKIKHEFVRRDGDLILAGAGTDLHAFIMTMIMHGIAGLTSMAGIPGTIGGAVRGNAGAYGVEIGTVVAWVDVLDTSTVPWTRRRLEPSDIAFRYRGSALTSQPHLVVWEVAFNLPERATPTTLLDLRANTIQQRRSKLPWTRSAGSFFKNLTVADLTDDQRRAIEQLGVAITHGKVAVGALNEKLGLKGRRIGSAQVSPAHGNYLTNTGGATAQQVRALAWTVWHTVNEATGVALEPEVQVLDSRGTIIPIAVMEADALALG